MSDKPKTQPLFDTTIVKQAIIDSFRKLDPRVQIRNPVMFVVLNGSVLTTSLFIHALIGPGEAPSPFILAVSLWPKAAARRKPSRCGAHDEISRRKNCRDLNEARIMPRYPPQHCAKATWCSSRPETSFPATVK